MTEGQEPVTCEHARALERVADLAAFYRTDESEGWHRAAARDLEAVLAARAGEHLAAAAEAETEVVEEARIHYRYGVNSGTLIAHNNPQSIAEAVEHHEQLTMGRIDVTHIETRTRVIRTTKWVRSDRNER